MKELVKWEFKTSWKKWGLLFIGYNILMLSCYLLMKPLSDEDYMLVTIGAIPALENYKLSLLALILCATISFLFIIYYFIDGVKKFSQLWSSPKGFFFLGIPRSFTQIILSKSIYYFIIGTMILLISIPYFYFIGQKYSPSFYSNVNLIQVQELHQFFRMFAIFTMIVLLVILKKAYNIAKPWSWLYWIIGSIILIVFLNFYFYGALAMLFFYLLTIVTMLYFIVYLFERKLEL